MKKMKWLAVALLAVCVAAPVFAQSNAEGQKPVRNLFFGRPTTKLNDKAHLEKYYKQYDEKLKALNEALEKATPVAVTGEQLKMREDCNLLLEAIEKSGKVDPGWMNTLKLLVEKEQDPKMTLQVLLMTVARYEIKPEQKVPTCAYCGKEIKEDYQHCAAKDGIGLCAEQKQQQGTYQDNQPAENCPVCGEKLTFDQRYHGVQHQCKPATQAQKAQKKGKKQKTPACIFCGKEITQANQPCSAGNGTGFCTTDCPDCGKNLRNPKNLGPDGVHRCNLNKSRIKPVTAQPTEAEK